MTHCPSCSTRNNKFLFILNKLIGKNSYCSKCKKELFLNGLSKTVLQGIGGAIVATLILYKFYYEKSNSSLLTITFSAIAAFLITFVLDVFKLKFSLTKTKKVEEIMKVKAERKVETTENHLYDIYSKRSSEELK